jgi:hypothetical protein
MANYDDTVMTVIMPVELAAEGREAEPNPNWRVRIGWAIKRVNP